MNKVVGLCVLLVLPPLAMIAVENGFANCLAQVYRCPVALRPPQSIRIRFEILEKKKKRSHPNANQFA
jgi:hypothetical protein